MLKLSMTSLCSNQIPPILPIFSQSIENLADFHKASIPQEASESKHMREKIREFRHAT